VVIYTPLYLNLEMSDPPIYHEIYAVLSSAKLKCILLFMSVAWSPVFKMSVMHDVHIFTLTSMWFEGGRSHYSIQPVCCTYYNHSCTVKV